MSSHGDCCLSSGAELLARTDRGRAESLEVAAKVMLTLQPQIVLNIYLETIPEQESGIKANCNIVF